MPPTPVRIGYVSASRLPSRDANAVHVVKMCRAFAGAGHEVRLFACAPPGAGARDVFDYYAVAPVFEIEPVRRSPLRAVWNAGYALRVGARLAAFAPDLIYGRHLYTLAYAARRLPAATVAYEAHALPGNPVQRSLEARLLRQGRVKRLVVISQALKEDYLRLFPFLAGDRIVVAHDAADPVAEAWEGAGAPRLPGRAGAVKACYAGRLIEGKGMRLLAELAPLCPEVDFHLFGGSAEEVRLWRARMGGSNVHFHGHLPHADLVRHYPLMDVMLAPLQPFMPLHRQSNDIGRWTSPLKLFEYMASGRPIICSDIPVLREVMEHGRNCLLCPHDDAGAWKSALTSLSGNPAMSAALARRAREEFHERFTWDARAQRSGRARGPVVGDMTDGPGGVRDVYVIHGPRRTGRRAALPAGEFPCRGGETA